MVENSQSELVNHRFYFQYGLTLERAGRSDDAGKMFEKAINLTPKEEIEDAANTMNYLGFMWLDQEKYLDKAGELIRKANELQPDNAAYIDSLGWWYFKKGDYSKALKELQRALGLIKVLESEDAEIVEHIAQTYLKMNELEKARESFEQARSLQPTGSEAVEASSKRGWSRRLSLSRPLVSPRLMVSLSSHYPAEPCELPDARNNRPKYHPTP
jgi:tetratricopeptide (TPR) repeat protein